LANLSCLGFSCFNDAFCILQRDHNFPPGE
jgi:hypothetical protein